MMQDDRLMDEKEFDNWLKQKLGYIDKSPRDVRSSVKRAGRFANLSNDSTDEELIFTISQNPDFKSLTASVKSQVKRGVLHPRNYNRRGVFSMMSLLQLLGGVNRPVPIGYPGHANDTAPLNGNIRPLTTIERSYLQTFPASFIFKGTKTALEQMIGNAVPVKLAEYVGRSLIDYINEVKINKPESERQLEFAFE